MLFWWKHREHQVGCSVSLLLSASRGSKWVSPGRLVTDWSRMKSSTSSDLSRYWPLGLARRVAMRARRMLDPGDRGGTSVCLKAERNRQTCYGPGQRKTCLNEPYSQNVCSFIATSLTLSPVSHWQMCMFKVVERKLVWVKINVW